jgi:hypothetical protein
MAVQGKASPDDVARARLSFEASKLMIPEFVSKTRERLENAKSRLTRPEALEADLKVKDRIRTARLRLEEAKKLRQEGKISEEDYLDVEGDYGILSLSSPEEESDPQAEIQSAQSELEAAEQLESKYLTGPPKPAAKDSKPR